LLHSGIAANKRSEFPALSAWNLEWDWTEPLSGQGFFAARCVVWRWRAGGRQDRMASGGLVALFWEATPESEFRRIPSASSVGTRYFPGDAAGGCRPGGRPLIDTQTGTPAATAGAPSVAILSACEHESNSVAVDPSLRAVAGSLASDFSDLPDGTDGVATGRSGLGTNGAGGRNGC